MISEDIVMTICRVLIPAIFGLAMGSFAGAQVWRLRARQLREDKARGYDVDASEYEKLRPISKTKVKEDRSRCLNCGHGLAAIDLIPLVSWVSTGGKCRYCHVYIGKFEPMLELITATIFVVLTLTWRHGWGGVGAMMFGLMIIASVMLVILFAYDYKWGLLPNKIVFPLIGVAIAYAALNIWAHGDQVVGILISTAGAVLILSGLYWALWAISKGAWVGFGDVKLGLALALLLGDWRLAFIALFVANLVGCLIVIPAMIARKMNRKAQVPFGPLLIVGFYAAFFLADFVLGLSLFNVLN